jgi:hypothetical protein
MYNTTIIVFGFRMISRNIQTSVNVIRLTFALADNIDLGLNNSSYHSRNLIEFLVREFVLVNPDNARTKSAVILN